jgi:hypothetical protein
LSFSLPQVNSHFARPALQLNILYRCPTEEAAVIVDEAVEAVEEEVVSSEVVEATARLVVGFKATVVVGVVAFAVGRLVVGAEGLSKEGTMLLSCIYGVHD